MFFFSYNPNSMWEIWKQLFFPILNEHVPLQNMKIKSKKSTWSTNNFKKMTLKQIAIITKLETDCEKYNRSKLFYNIQLKQAKKITAQIKLHVKDKI